MFEDFTDSHYNYTQLIFEWGKESYDSCPGCSDETIHFSIWHPDSYYDPFTFSDTSPYSLEGDTYIAFYKGLRNLPLITTTTTNNNNNNICVHYFFNVFIIVRFKGKEVYGSENNVNTKLRLNVDIKPEIYRRIKDAYDDSFTSSTNGFIAPVFIWIICFAEALAISHLVNNDRKTGIRKILMMMGLQVNYSSSSSNNNKTKQSLLIAIHIIIIIFYRVALTGCTS